MSAAAGISRHRMTAAEVAAVTRVADGLVDLVGAGRGPAREQARAAARHLPASVTELLDRFHQREFAAVVVLSGYQVDDDRIGPTPTHWRRGASRTEREEAYLLCVASLVGEPFSWSTLQDGRLVQNVLPVAGEEGEQSGHGSTVTLAWHTEDAFHPLRCDYLGLLALRNPERTPTTIASIESVSLAAPDRTVLAEPRFLIEPDNEHRLQGMRHGSARPTAARARPAPLPPTRAPVLFGDLAAPYLRIDPYFMRPVDGDPAAARALATLIEQLDAGSCDLVLEPGELCLIDNYRAVHGRWPFRPRYDGSDRWLKKICVARDLRKARSLRSSVESHLLRLERVTD
jgi:Fe(II)/alpha-ketoglutarate-dependent arginine beta-hydroxylase